ncbi:TetR family transcriptional regulator [Mycolicibacterium sp. A43C]
MPPDSTNTKVKLLAAAHDEFAEKGLAGARVDQIAARAGVNKRLIYLHFGAKEVLFDLVVARALQTMSAAVPFTGDDLAHYAGALFDYLVDHPDVLRLTGWANLERPKATAEEVDAYRPKVLAVEDAQQRGVLTNAVSAQHLLAVVLGIITAWANASPALRSLDDSAAPLLKAREVAVVAVRQLSTPATSP